MAEKKGTEKTKEKKKGTGQIKVGDVYSCQVCGLAVTVDEICGCVEACDIICCQKPMKKKRAKR